jgi:hypothetical protein
MTAIRATIDAGICGFITEVTAISADEQTVEFSVASPCERIQGLAKRLPTVDAFREIGMGFEGAVHKAVRESLKGCCSGCVVPAGVFKAMQVVAGLALPKEASMTFARIDKEEE